MKPNLKNIVAGLDTDLTVKLWRVENGQLVGPLMHSAWLEILDALKQEPGVMVKVKLAEPQS